MPSLFLFSSLVSPPCHSVDVTGRWATGSWVAQRLWRFYWPWSLSGCHNEEVPLSPSAGSNGCHKGLDCSCCRTLLHMAEWLLNSFNHLSGSYTTCHLPRPFCQCISPLVPLLLKHAKLTYNVKHLQSKKNKQKREWPRVIVFRTNSASSWTFNIKLLKYLYM